MTESAKATWSGIATGALQPLRTAGAITFASAIVTDSAAGILRDSTVTLTVRITPQGKAEQIVGSVVYYVTPAGITAEEAA